MTEEEWTEEAAAPPKKKGLPSWLLFCGGGCLIAVVLGAIAVFLIFNQVKQMINPAQQWDDLEAAIEMDDRPHELNMIMGWHLGIDVWMMHDSRGYIVAIYDFGESEAEGRDEIFSESFEGGGLPGVNEIEDAVLAEVTVQGRQLKVQRFTNSGGFNLGASESVQGGGAACFVDITPEESPGFSMLFVMNDPSQKKAEADEPISDAAIQDILKPFLIGPTRETFVSPGPHPQDGVEEVDFEEVFNQD